MTNKLFVASLAYSVTDQTLANHFSQAGTVVSANVIVDRTTGKSKGFGFVEMSNEEEAKKAIETLNNSELEGRTIIVNEARPREDRPSSGGGGGNFRRDNRGRDNRGGGRGHDRGGSNRW